MAAAVAPARSRCLQRRRGRASPLGTQAIVELFSRYAVLERRQLCEAFYRCSILAEADRPPLCLRGLFTADGTVANYGDEVSVRFAGLLIADAAQTNAASPSLFRHQIEALLRTAERLLCHNCPDGKGGHSAYQVTQMHSLRISRSSALAFEKQIGFHPASRKSRALGALNARCSLCGSNAR